MLWSRASGPIRRVRTRLRLRTQVLLLQIVVIAVSLAVGFGVLISGSGDRLREEYAQRALAVARSVAADQQVRDAVAAYSRDPASEQPVSRLLEGSLQAQAVAVTRRTGALFVVIADVRGMRLAHPDPGQVGRPLSTDPARALSGAEDIATDRGTLGESVRAKVPVLDGSGRVIGLVSVGISTARIRDDQRSDLLTTVGIAGAALAVGVVGSAALARRWRRLTLGLEPDQLAELVREQEAVLHSVGDGVVAVDAAGVVRVINDRARELLAPNGSVGDRLDDIGLTPRIMEIARDPVEVPRAAAVGDRIVLASSRRVRRDGRDLGVVMSVVDRTDVEGLTREVESIKAMSDALRAQRHESANRMHVVAGLIRQGHASAALDYLDEISGTGRFAVALPGLENVTEPHLHAFLDAKAAGAREHGVTLMLGPQTWLDTTLTAPIDVVTIVGNLIDNAVDAARKGHRSPPVVELELVADGSDLVVTVADSGDGIALERIGFDDVESVFVEGVTTHADPTVPGGRGMGLALSRQSARGHGGDVVIGDPGGGPGTGGSSPENPLGGAIMVARLPGVLRPDAGANDEGR